MEGISKDRLADLLSKLERKISDQSQIEYRLLENLIEYECTELHPIPEYKDLPQAVLAQEGTVINISDGDNKGKWVSTKEGWIPLK
jgi:hypothetical protein